MNPGFTGQYGNAVVQQNTAGATFKATLPSTNFDPYTGSTISGSLTATVPSNGSGVMITVNFSGFPAEAEYGPFGASEKISAAVYGLTSGASLPHPWIASSCRWQLHSHDGSS